MIINWPNFKTVVVSKEIGSPEKRERDREPAG